MFTSRTRIYLALIGTLLSHSAPAHAKVLFQASFDVTAHADYAGGNRVPRPAVTKTYQVAGLSSSARWGRALDMTNAAANCTFEAAKNFNPKRGTLEMWFRITEHKGGMYHPLFGWYRPPHQPGAKKRLSAMEVYLHNSTMVLGLHTPKYQGMIKAAPIAIGRWHHLEVNWDCVQGKGQSVYNIFLDGKSLIRVTGGGALVDGAGGRIHLGTWDYGFSHITRGQIDGLRITDQVEHSRDFDPPTKPYATPGTLEYAKATHRRTIERLRQFQAETRTLTKFSGAKGDSAAARAIRRSQATAKEVERKLASLKPSLNADDPDVSALAASVDAVADRLSTARLPIHRITTKAAALAAAEDRRSLLFKDLNDALLSGAIFLNGRQLFIDDYIVEETKNLTRGIHYQPAKERPGKLTAHRTRGSLLYDRKEKQFKLWCIVDTPDRKNQALCYATSANGLDWQKPKKQPPLNLGQDVSFYEQGLNRPHSHSAVLERGLVLTTNRRDGFVSMDAGDQGVLTTRRFIAIGDTLVLNAQAGRGDIRVEAIDALGRVIKGFSKEDCKPISSESTQQVVSWVGGTNCHPLQARPIKLRFYLRRAKLFSFDFQIRENHYVPESYRQK